MRGIFRRRIWFIISLQLTTFLSYSQSSSIKGKVLDDVYSAPLYGASIIISDSNGHVNYAQAMTNIDGSFLLDNLNKGRYLLSITYVGFQEDSRSITLSGDEIDLGIIRLKEGVQLNEIIVVEQVVPVIQKGDTTQFDAEAYTILPDASTEDLIEKMPSIIIADGKVQAQGEDVKQVLVDGKPFFGNDPNAALKNLPAEVVDKIQIFDKQSEQAQFTGFDDGESSKTINIVTKTHMRHGEFGNIYAGYGYDSKYQVGGNINIFKCEQRLSVIGMSNNINQQNFSIEDLLGIVGSTGRTRGGNNNRAGVSRNGNGKGGNSSGVSTNDFLVPQQGGITKSDAFGVNFSDKWCQKVDFSASYFFNQSNNTTEQLVLQQYFDTEGIGELYNEESLIESTNTNHRFLGKVNYEINERNSLMWQAKITWQGNEGTEDLIGQTLFDNSLLSQTNLDFRSELSGLNLDNSLLWKHKFNKDRRTLSVNVSSGFAPQTGESFLFSENSMLIDGLDSIVLHQKSILDLGSWNISTHLQYTEPLNEESMLLLSYRTSYQKEKSEKETFDFDDNFQDYVVFNPGLSNISNSAYHTQQLGGGFSYRKSGFIMNINVIAQRAQLLSEQAYPIVGNTENTFLNLLPIARLRLNISRTKNLSLVYRTNTQSPSIGQLQDVVDNNNPLQLIIGNSELVQSYQHSLFARYSVTNTQKSSVFYVLLKGGYTNNYIGSSTYLATSDNSLPLLVDNDISDGSQLTQPVNLHGLWNLRSFTTYGFPVRVLKSNLNIDFTMDFTRTPGLINEELNYIKNTNIGAGLTFGSNIGEQVDFTLVFRRNYNTASNSLHTETDTDYLNQHTRFKLNWILANDIVIRTDVTHQYYKGLSDDFDQNYLLWNMSIGKKIFKNKRGEISLSVYDLLNQNNNLSRLNTEIYTEDIQTNVLQQYFMLRFKYDLRHFTLK